MDPEPEHVDRGLEQFGVDPVPEERRSPIGLDQVPETIDDQRRVRLVCLQQPAERLAQRSHHLAVVGLLQIGRSEAPREQQAVALGDRQVQMLGEVDEELATRARAAGLDEAEVLGGEVRVQRQVQLAEAPLAPEADQLTRGLGLLLGLDGHPLTGASAQVPLPGCKRRLYTEVIDARPFLGTVDGKQPFKEANVPNESDNEGRAARRALHGGLDGAGWGPPPQGDRRSLERGCDSCPPAHAGGLRGRRRAGREPDLAGARPRRARSEGDLGLRGFRGDRPDVFSVGRARSGLGMWSLGAGKESHRMARCSAPASSS